MGTYKLAIADDEMFIRESLVRYVRWEEIGFEVVLVAEDGEPLIRALEERGKIDVIFCDIQMQVQSGLDVARYVAENGLDCVVVLLSGYQEFEFARKALQYGVEDYLLKPVNLSDIRKTFTRIREALDERQRKRMERLHREEQIMAGQYLLVLNMCEDFEEIWNRIGEELSAREDGVDMDGLTAGMAALLREKYGEGLPGELEEMLLDGGSEEGRRKALYEVHCYLHTKEKDITVSGSVKKLVREHLDENISLTRAAEHVFLSPNYFSRIFKEQVGENYSEYVIRIKMEKAAELLRDSHRKIYEISEQVGYHNIKYFYKLFKRIYACTPIEYRKRHLYGREKQEDIR